MMTPKDGRLESPAYLGFVRRQICFACTDEIAKGKREFPNAYASDAHHVNGKGMGGARCRDDETIPLCRYHHEREADIEHSLQVAWTALLRCAFLEQASDYELKSYLRALQTWRARPLSVPF